MLRFKNVAVRGLDIDALTISWEIDPVDPVQFDISQIEFRVYRSNSPEGPFDLLTDTPLVDEFSFEDTQLNRRSFWRKHYYKIEATRTTDSQVRDSIVHKAEVNPTKASQLLIGLEIARRERLLLSGIGITPGYNGVPCVTLIRRTFGQRCALCFDFTLQKQLESKCIRCFDTHFVGGYFKPIQSHINFSPSPEILQVVNWGETQPSETDCWLSNYPMLSPGDVIVEPTNRRWKVVRQHRTEQLRVPIRQIIRLFEINRSDVEYLFPLDDSLFEEPEFSELTKEDTEFWDRDH